MLELQPLQSRRPEDTPFKQQRMPAWQPILTPKVVIVLFSIIGIMFIPIGVACLSASQVSFEGGYCFVFRVFVVVVQGVVEIKTRYDTLCASNRFFINS